MPFTPFHLGPGLLVGLLLFSALHLPTLLVANMIPDVEPLYAIAACPSCAHHGFWHSLAGASILAAILSIAVLVLKKPVERLSELFRVKQKASWKNVLPAAFLGTWLHVLLDSTLYPDMKPFFPLNANPLYVGNAAFVPVYALCALSFAAGMVLYFLRVGRK